MGSEKEPGEGGGGREAALLDDLDDVACYFCVCLEFNEICVEQICFGYSKFLSLSGENSFGKRKKVFAISVKKTICQKLVISDQNN